MAQTLGHIVCIADRDQLIAVAGGGKKDLIMKSIHKDLENVINERVNVLAATKDKSYCKISNDEEEYAYEVITPIISEGDAIGAVIILTKDTKIKFGELEVKLAQSSAGFLGRQMEQ